MSQPAGANIADDVREAPASCGNVVVLIGPSTQQSRWGDMEMELAIAPRPDRPPAGLKSNILPEHADVAEPYYEPRRAPPRVYDRVHWKLGVSDYKDPLAAEYVHHCTGLRNRCPRPEQAASAAGKIRVASSRHLLHPTNEIRKALEHLDTPTLFVILPAKM